MPVAQKKSPTGEGEAIIDMIFNFRFPFGNNKEEEKKQAATYSPTRLGQYHRRRKA